MAIAKNILKVAESYGIEKKDIIFDPLVLTVSADPEAAEQTIRAVADIRNDLGVHTSLGVSNVSFGLPNRDVLNATFFALALANGLSAAIMNPFSNEMMKTYHSYLALAGLDAGFEKYISFSSVAENLVSSAQSTTGTVPTGEMEYSSELQKAVVKGLGSLASSLTQELIKTKPPLEVVQDEIIPALDIVGKGFEEKRIYLPQLLMSAEAAKAAFEVVKNNSSGNTSQNRGRVIIATVKGDIHDIGKNIVKLLLENYGFNVYDMGRDVSPEDIANKVIELDARLLGLSALMTTTVPAMEETIRLVHEKKPDCKIVVGGAVLTQSYADAIGADKYAPDAMETVRYAELLENIL